MAERDYWNHPGGNNCFWNTPIGTGATWSMDGDLDQRDLRAGTPIINPPGNYGCAIWVSRSASDPSATFTGQHSADFEVNGGNGSWANKSVVLRAPRGAYTPGGSGATPVDGQFVVFDTTGNPGWVHHFAPLVIANFQGGGSYTSYFGAGENALSDLFCTDYETKNANFSQAAGVIRNYDLDPAQNPARLPAPYSYLTKIQHVLRYAIDGLYLKENMVNSPTNSHLRPNSWPQYYHDWQGDIAYNRYRGQLLYGSTVGIPLNVPMPSGLSDPGKQLWFAYQRYGAVTRDQAGGGIHNTIDQYVPDAWRQAAEADLRSYIRPQLRIMRNQHQGGQSFTTNPMQGPGTRSDEGPPPLRGTTPVPAPVVSPSPSGTVVLSGSGGVITDATGNKWTLPGTQVVLNGVTDTSTSSVTQLAYVNGVVWCQNTSGLWYGKSSPTAAWSPAGGTTTNPVTGITPPPPSTTESPNKTVVISGSTNSIIDSTGNKWTLPGSQVVLNGVIDASTSSVVQLAYVNHVVWCQNTSGLWYGKSSPTASWSPAGGTTTNPVTGTIPPPPSTTESPDKTVVISGATTSIIDSTGNKWTLPGSQVVLNGVIDASTANVVQLAYVNKVVWCQNTSGLWYGKSSPTASWSPVGGTRTDPVTGATTPPPTTESPDKTVVISGSSGVIVDSTGNKWTLPGTRVVLNGVTDTTTANVTRLAYVNRIVWCRNTSGLWYGKSSPTAAWSPPGGTTTSPLV